MVNTIIYHITLPVAQQFHVIVHNNYLGEQSLYNFVLSTGLCSLYQTKQVSCYRNKPKQHANKQTDNPLNNFAAARHILVMNNNIEHKISKFLHKVGPLGNLALEFWITGLDFLQLTCCLHDLVCLHLQNPRNKPPPPGLEP